MYKSAWLIGANGGVGKAFRETLLECTQNLHLVDRTEVSELREQDTCHIFDCSNEHAVLKFANRACELSGPPDVLVIAAGLVASIELVDSTAELSDELYKNNFLLVLLLLKAFLECCDKNPAVPKAVVVLSSNAAHCSRPSQPIYAAMKSAICSLCASAAVEYGKWGVRINCIAPGTIAVKRNEQALKAKLPNFPEDMSRPLGRILLPEDLQNTLQMLLTKDCMLTGQTIVVDGGSSL